MTDPTPDPIEGSDLLGKMQAPALLTPTHPDPSQGGLTMTERMWFIAHLQAQHDRLFTTHDARTMTVERLARLHHLIAPDCQESV
jgi:hypothetical protein